jgi:UDP-GlcNAc3NAcA epimerase
MHLLTIIGARPQIIKAAAMSRAIASLPGSPIRETILHTGQHYDANMSQVFFDELGIPRPDIALGVGSGSHGVQTARMIEGVEAALLEHRPDAVLLYGDTNSTLAGAVAAAKLRIPVAHVEAGLRSFNKAMPEEVNRIVCDHCSTWLFCPTQTAMDNLRNEGFDLSTDHVPTADRPHVMLSGDVMYDNSMYFASMAEQRSTLMADLGVRKGSYILATVHRDNTTDDPERLNAVIGALLSAYEEHGLEVILPLHPRTRQRMNALLASDLSGRIERATGFHVVPPAGFLDMIALERHARLVMTDSGGVQKEAYFFGVPCVILRPETEWVELVAHGQALLADADPERIAEAVRHFLTEDLPAVQPLFGDGHAAERICAELLNSSSRR